MDSNQSEYESLFTFRSNKERLEFNTDRIQLDILTHVNDIMDKKGISRSELADKLKVSKSYISQLFSCDKRLNLKTLAQLEQVLDAKFYGTPQDNNANISEENIRRKTGVK